MVAVLGPALVVYIAEVSGTIPILETMIPRSDLIHIIVTSDKVILRQGHLNGGRVGTRIGRVHRGGIGNDSNIGNDDSQVRSDPYNRNFRQGDSPSRPPEWWPCWDPHWSCTSRRYRERFQYWKR